MTLAELWHTLLARTVNNKGRRDVLIQLHRRFSLPFACFVFAPLAIPLASRTSAPAKPPASPSASVS